MTILLPSNAPSSWSEHPFDRDYRKRVAAAWLDGPKKGPCRSPFITSYADGTEVVAPCRRCLACRNRRSRTLIGRAVAETTLWTHSQSICFTYDEENLPLDAEISKDFLDKEWDALRKRVAYHAGKHKYMAVAQISPQGRLHWHCIFWTEGALPAPSGFRELIPADALWKKGHRHVQPVNAGSARYIADYLSRGGAKGTIRWKKSARIGEQYFRTFLEGVGLKRWANPPSSYYPVPDENGEFRWYPMDQRFREIADEMGVDYTFHVQKGPLQWIGEGGVAEANRTAWADRLHAEKLARIPEKEREHPLVAEIKLGMKINGR